MSTVSRCGRDSTIAIVLLSGLRTAVTKLV